jgi:hypothetical protein
MTNKFRKLGAVILVGVTLCGSTPCFAGSGSSFYRTGTVAGVLAGAAAGGVAGAKLGIIIGGPMGSPVAFIAGVIIGAGMSENSFIKKWIVKP